MKCRSCSSEVREKFLDLRNAPPSNSYLTEKQLNEPELFYPLSVYVCTECWLVQIDEYKKSSEIFSEDYAYYSSFSSSWLEHAKQYSEMIIKRLDLSTESHVVEIASNDGYLLKNFVKNNIPCYGVEPTTGTAQAARKVGVNTKELFFTKESAEKLKSEHGTADLIIGNNVLAHVPDINDFVEGVSLLLSDSGTVTMEFPHLLNLIQQNQFDTIYHEHYSYLSLTAVVELFKRHSLVIYDVEELDTHGGSLRIYAKKMRNTSIELRSSVDTILTKEIEFGIKDIVTYSSFQKRVNKLKYSFLEFLLEQKRNGKSVAAYGAAAKGNTFLNYCGVGNDLIEFVVDASPHKQGKYLPGSHIPIVNQQKIQDVRPDYVVVFPWNLIDEIETQLSYIQTWGARLVTAIPDLRVF